MRTTESFTKTRLLVTVAWIVGLALAGAASYYAGTRGVTYREIIVALLAAAGGVLLLSNENGELVGLVACIFSLGLGYRTVEINNYLRLHPSEVILWTLLFLLVLHRSATGKRHFNVVLPRWLWLLLPFWALTWINGIRVGRSTSLMINEFRNFLVLVPLYLLTYTTIRSRWHWKVVLLTFYVLGAGVACFGLFEYAVPGVAQAMPYYIGDSSPVVTAEGFLRAKFAFWGAPAATFICLLSLPLANVAVLWCRTLWQKLLIYAGVVLQVLAIYIGGYRSVWTILGVVIVLWVWGRYGVLRGTIYIAPLVVAYLILPAPALDRLQSLGAAVQGVPMDSSLALRIGRAVEAYNTMVAHPLGVGWAGTGWTHSDLLQVAANQGVLAWVILVTAYLSVVKRAWSQVRRCRDAEEQALGLALLLAHIAAGGLLAVEGVQVLIQLVLPVWLVWVLADIWLRQRNPIGEPGAESP